MEQIKAGADGAVCVFDGIVRNNTRGRQTLCLDYEAKLPMALTQMEGLAREALQRFAVRDLALLQSPGTAPYRRDKRPDCCGERPPRSRIRGLPLADRYSEEAGPDLEERMLRGWSRLGRRRAVPSRNSSERSLGANVYSSSSPGGPLNRASLPANDRSLRVIVAAIVVSAGAVVTSAIVHPIVARGIAAAIRSRKIAAAVIAAVLQVR